MHRFKKLNSTDAQIQKLNSTDANIEQIQSTQINANTLKAQTASLSGKLMAKTIEADNIKST